MEGANGRVLRSSRSQNSLATAAEEMKSPPTTIITTACPCSSIGDNKENARPQKRKQQAAVVCESSQLALVEVEAVPLKLTSTTAIAPPPHAVVPLPTAPRAKGSSKWVSTSPFYVADGRLASLPPFPPRKRSSICYICGEEEQEDTPSSDLMKCSTSNCNTRFHHTCARVYGEGGGYTYNFMQRNKGVHCPRHHCAGCFADHNRVRAFHGPLIACGQCELAWHKEGCVPGGCTIEAKSKELTCPRHVAFPNPPHLHTLHCIDCQQRPAEGERLLKCANCLRSMHIKCSNEAGGGEPNELHPWVCSWCTSCDFVRRGQYCMGRLSATRWYPCQVVGNEDYPNQKDAVLGSVGHLVVRWLPYRGRTFYNVLSHNRVIPITEKDFYFCTEAHKSNILAEWEEAQLHSIAHSPENSTPLPSQISALHSNNGERVRKIAKCKYTTPDTRPSKERQLESVGHCQCPTKGEGMRCGPDSSCINRALHLECPEGCDRCDNRRISTGQNCVAVEVKPSNGRFYGAFTLEDIPRDGFVGEYVGEVITHAEKGRRIERIAQFNSIEAQYYIMDLDGHRAIDAQFYGNDMRYVNHSCSPNTTIQVITTSIDVHVVLVALRDISKGEELCFDYNMYSSVRGRSVPRCRCSAPNCTGVLSAKSNNKEEGKRSKKK